MKLLDVDWSVFGRGKPERPCEACAFDGSHGRRSARRCLRLLGVPVLPLGPAHPFWECTGCRETFQDGEPLGATDRAVRIVLLYGLYSGGSKSADAQGIRSVYRHVMNRPWALEDFDSERAAWPRDARLTKQLRPVAACLKRGARESVLTAVLLQSADDGLFDEREQEWVLETARALKVSLSRLRHLIEELGMGTRS